MAGFPALPLWTDAYLADTRHLTTTEHGAYLLLLLEAWRRPNCSLPDDDTLLARFTGLSAVDWTAAKPIVMAFWKLDGRSKTWTQKRLKKELTYVKGRSKVQSDKASKRWKDRKEKDAAALPQQSRGNAPTPIITLPNGKGAEAPPIDPGKALFDAGIALLTSTGMTIRSARSMIAKWRRDCGDGWTRDALASAAGKSDPVGWIEKMKRRGAAAEDEARAASSATAERYRRMGIAGPPPSQMANAGGATR